MPAPASTPLPGSRPKSRLSFRDRALVYLGLGTVQRSIAVFMAPLYAHSLVPMEYGWLGFVLSIEALFAVLLDCGLSSGIMRSYFLVDERRAQAFGSYAQLASLSLTAAILAVLAGGLAICLWFVPEPPFIAIALATALLSALAQRINGVAATLYRAQEDVRSFALLSFSRVIGIPLVTLAVLLLFHLDLVTIILTRLIVFAATACFELVQAWRRIDPAEPRIELRQMLHASFKRYSLPLLPHNLMRWGRGQGTRALLAGAMPIAALGVYNVAILPLTILSLTSTAFDQLFEPFYYREMREGGQRQVERVRTAASLLLAVQAALCIAAMPFMPDIFRLFFPREYWDAAIYAPLLLAGQLMIAVQSLLLKPLVQAGRVKALPVISATSTILGAIVTFACASRFGLAGAALGYTATAALSAIFAWIMVRKGNLMHTLPIGHCLLFSALALGAGAVPLLLGEVDRGNWWLVPASAFVRYPLYLVLSVAVFGPMMTLHRDLMMGMLRGGARKGGGNG